jgi:hypothetical protein
MTDQMLIPFRSGALRAGAGKADLSNGEIFEATGFEHVDPE